MIVKTDRGYKVKVYDNGWVTKRMNRFYRVNSKGEIRLKDHAITEALQKVVEMYDDGAILETRDVLQDIVDAINMFEIYEERANE